MQTFNSDSNFIVLFPHFHIYNLLLCKINSTALRKAKIDMILAFLSAIRSCSVGYVKSDVSQSMRKDA